MLNEKQATVRLIIQITDSFIQVNCSTRILHGSAALLLRCYRVTRRHTICTPMPP